MEAIKLTEHIRKFTKLSEKESLILHQHTVPVQVEKAEFLSKENDDCKSIYFVEQGCLRMFFGDRNSDEQITQFAIEGWWLTDYFSFMDRKPSEYSIQALEQSSLISIDRDGYHILLKKLPQLDGYFRYIMQRNVAASQLRIKYLYEMTQEELYTKFIRSFPEFVKRVPLSMVASYLGISTKTGSKTEHITDLS